MEKIAIIGASGQVGQQLSRFLSKTYNIVELDHNDVEISQLDSCHILKEIKPQLIINTAAFHHVERCENDAKKSFEINSIGPRNLSLIANDIDATILHISTDYVFDGIKKEPYIENDSPNPINVYGNSKLAGEYFVKTIAKRYFIVRTAALYSEYECRAKGNNFITLMKRLASEKEEVRVVDSEIVSPTNVKDLTLQIEKLINTDQFGLYHACCGGMCSWHQFASIIFKRLNLKSKLSVASPNEFPNKVARPKFSPLENKKINDLNINVMRYWQDALESYLEIL